MQWLFLVAMAAPFLYLVLGVYLVRWRNGRRNHRP
jgi:hypothetical protein